MPTPRRPTAFMLHALGASRREFDAVAARLDDVFETVALDLPGFGDAGTDAGTTVEAMRDDVLARIRAHGATRWILVGHSMGGKVASAVAATVLAGAPGVFGLSGVVLLAASPPTPEPMEESRRASMLGWASSSGGASSGGASSGGALRAHLDGEAARTFIDANIGSPLPAPVDAAATADVERARPEAWVDWLTRGSREDWSGTVGVLDLPALIVAGGADGDLGADAQRSLNGPVYPHARFATLEGAGHLLPLERPDEVAELIRSFWTDWAGRAPVIPEPVVATIAGGHTSARTRSILAARALADDPAYEPQVLDAAQLGTLRAIADRVVPQGPGRGGAGAGAADASDASGAPRIDLAARVDAQLAAGKGDGWRNADLPTDPDAYRIGLDALAGFADMTPEEQDARIAEIVDGSFVPPHGDSSAGDGAGNDGNGDAGNTDAGNTDAGNTDAGNTDADSDAFDASQMTIWFEDARVDLVRLWLSHPATMARIGFDGFANGGDGVRKQGFRLLGADQREGWEPIMEVVR